jgi:parvulin-like peptidyl-prolyl isomerase
MKKFLIILAAFAAFSAPAQAQETIKVLSTQELVNTCKLPASPESRSFCIGFTTAIYETYLATRHPQNAKPFICVKQPAPARDEVISDFVKFAQSNQQVADKPASGVFLGFMATRFPCARK